MNILLVNPYITDFTAYDLWLRPLGLYSLAAVLHKYTDAEIHWLDLLDRFSDKTDGAVETPGKYPREIISKPAIYRSIPRNYSRYGIPWLQFQEKLKQLPHPDLILMTTLMTYWIDGAALVIEELKHKFPSTPLIIGGILPTLLGESVTSMLDCDGFVRGYGEIPVLNIVAGLGGTVGPHPDFSEINRLPFPLPGPGISHSATPLLTSRGCPLQCLYCASGLLNPRFQERDPDEVLAWIHMKADRGVTDFVLFDDALLSHKEKRFHKIFNPLAGKGLRFHTPNGLHAGEIDEKTAKIMHQCGFQRPRLSFESVSDPILDASSRKIDCIRMNRAVTLLEQAGYDRSEIEAYLLFGYPEQTVKEVDATLDFIAAEHIIPRLSVFSPVPGTQVYKKLQEKGILARPGSMYETNKIYFLYEKSGLSREEIDRLKRRTARICAAAAVANL